MQNLLASEKITCKETIVKKILKLISELPSQTQMESPKMNWVT